MARIARMPRFGEFLNADIIGGNHHFKRRALRNLPRHIAAGAIGEARRDPGFCRDQRCRFLQRRLQADGSGDQWSRRCARSRGRQGHGGQDQP